MKLLFDFGLVILIWIVQLIIYPSFAYYQEKDLLIWHQKYTQLITIVVLPLMVGQLGLHIYGLTKLANATTILPLVLVISTWIITFVWAVPLHNKIDQAIDLPNTIKKLVSINWYRTILWSIVFITSLMLSIKTNRVFE